MTQEIGIREVLQQVDARIASLDGRMDRLEQAMLDLRREMLDLRREMLTNFRWTVAIVLTSWGTLMAALISLSAAILARL